MDILHVHPQLAGSSWAIGLFVFGLIAAGIPVASLCLVLCLWTRRDRHAWQAPWGRVFQAGFTVQICSIAVTVPAWLSELLDFATFGNDMATSVSLAFLTVNLVTGGFALRGWRRLMEAALPDKPPSIVR